MNTRANGTPIPPSASVDLTQVTEGTRRKLYDAAVATHFTATPEETAQAVSDPDHWRPPLYAPDEAGLTVLYLYGRWLIVWRRLEEGGVEPAEPCREWAVLRVVQDSVSGGLEYHEV